MEPNGYAGARTRALVARPASLFARLGMMRVLGHLSRLRLDGHSNSLLAQRPSIGVLLDFYGKIRTPDFLDEWRAAVSFYLLTTTLIK
jgi:hypothetical protein